MRIVCVEMVTKMMSVDEAFEVVGVRNELLGTQDRTLAVAPNSRLDEDQIVAHLAGMIVSGLPSRSRTSPSPFP